jgi:hypothetical protein
VANPSELLVAAPGESSTGAPSAGPHSDHAIRRSVATWTAPRRAGALSSKEFCPDMGAMSLAWISTGRNDLRIELAKLTPSNEAWHRPPRDGDGAVEHPRVDDDGEVGSAVKPDRDLVGSDGDRGRHVEEVAEDPDMTSTIAMCGAAKPMANLESCHVIDLDGEPSSDAVERKTASGSWLPGNRCCNFKGTSSCP